MIKNDNTARGFIRVPAMAKALGVRDATVLRWIRRGVLPAVKLGRVILIPKNALERALDREERKHA